MWNRRCFLSARFLLGAKLSKGRQGLTALGLALLEKPAFPHSRPFLSQALGITIPVNLRAAGREEQSWHHIGPVGLRVGAIHSLLHN